MDNTQNQNNDQPIYDQQTPRADYGFINEYASPSPKRSKKTLLFSGALIMGMLILALVLLLASNGQNSPKQATNPKVATVPESGGSLFIDDVIAERYPEAYTKMSVGLKQRFDGQSDFETRLAKPMRTLLTKNECTVQVNTNATRSVIHKCTVNGFDFWAGVGLLDKGSEKEIVYAVCSLSDKELTVCQ